MKKKGREPVTPPRPVKHTLHFLLHGSGNDTVKGTLVLDNFPLTGDLGVGGLSTAEPQDEYDQAGATVYAIVVIAVYGFSIVMLIASHIFLKKKRDKRDGGDEKQIEKYLAQVPSLKEKSKRDSFRRLKKSIIPLISISMANDITTAIAAGPMGHSVIQRHMDVFDRIGRSPSRSPSGGLSPVGNRSPTGALTPRTRSPSLEESDEETVRLDMALERDRSFDRVSQSRMPIIVEIDEVTDSPTMNSQPLVTADNKETVGKDYSDAVSNEAAETGIVNPWEEQEGRGRRLRRGDTPRPVSLPSYIDVAHYVSPHTPSSQLHTPDTSPRSRSPRRCSPYDLKFDFPPSRSGDTQAGDERARQSVVISLQPETGQTVDTNVSLTGQDLDGLQVTFV